MGLGVSDRDEAIPIWDWEFRVGMSRTTDVKWLIPGGKWQNTDVFYIHLLLFPGVTYGRSISVAWINYEISSNWKDSPASMLMFSSLNRIAMSSTFSVSSSSLHPPNNKGSIAAHINNNLFILTDLT